MGQQTEGLPRATKVLATSLPEIEIFQRELVKMIKCFDLFFLKKIYVYITHDTVQVLL